MKNLIIISNMVILGIVLQPKLVLHIQVNLEHSFHAYRRLGTKVQVSVHPEIISLIDSFKI